MLISLHMKNFRRHEDLVVDFTTGLNVLRGANEGGKSTVIEAVLYALYGSKALRDTFEETVTWGKAEKELSVKLVIRVDDIDYVFTRAKGGAEVNYHDGKVVGQAEVTSFSSNLLGADAKTANLIMLASQSGLRGSLDDGPAAVSSLMGKLADFDMIDRLLENATKRLLLGSEQPIQAKLTATEAELAAAVEAVPDPVMLAQATAQLAIEQAALSASESVSVATLEPAMLAADEALTAGRNANELRRSSQATVAALTASLAGSRSDLATATAEAAKKPDLGRMEALRAGLASDALLQAQLRAYASFQRLPAYPASFWEGPKAEFDAALVDSTTKARVSAENLAAVKADIAALTRTLITNGKCPTCGSLAASDEHVANHNAPIRARITELQASLGRLEEALAADNAELQALVAVQKVAQGLLAAAAPLGDQVEHSTDAYPPRITWRGAVPVAQDRAAEKLELQQLEATERAAAQAEGRVTVLTAAVAKAEADLATAEQLLAGRPLVELAPLEEAYAAANRAYMLEAERQRALRQQIQTLGQLKADAERAQADSERVVAAARKRIDEINSDLKALAFNNGLVKKLKTLKPAITDHLWNSVLAAVSNFFSTLRGEQSVVTKDAKGFKVNGKSIESLSGSTIDVLALAIRVALSKTFIPHASFMVLDEPAHGCDDTRTANVLGFLASVGFQQTVLASHDELSEAVADNVIALGA